MSVKSRTIAAVTGVAGAGVALTVGLLVGAGSSGATQPTNPVPAGPDCAGHHHDNSIGAVHNAAFIKTGEDRMTVGAVLASGVNC